MDESVVKHFEQQQAAPEKPAQKMRFSEAMRKGAKLRPQGFCNLFVTRHEIFVKDSEFSFRYVGFASCAMGAALEGAGISVDEVMSSAAHLRVATVGQRSILNFDLARIAFQRCMGFDIEAANDTLRMSREAIADTLERLGY